MDQELNQVGQVFDGLALSSEGLLICYQNRGNNFEMKFFEINGLKLSATEFNLRGDGEVQFMKGLHGNMIAVTLFDEHFVRIYDIAKSALKFYIDMGLPVMDLEVVSDEKFVVLTENGFKMISATTGDEKMVENDFGFEGESLFALKDGRFGVLGYDRIIFYDKDAFLFSSIPLTKFHSEKQVNSVIAVDRGRIAVATNENIKIYDFEGSDEPPAKRFKSSIY